MQVGTLQFGNVNAALFKQAASNYVEAVTGFSMGAGASAGVAMQSGGITAGPNASIGFNGGNGIGASDVRLSRSAAGVMQVGTTANNSLGMLLANGFRIGASGTELFDGNLRRPGSFVFRHNVDGKPSMRNWAETNGVTFDHSTTGLLSLRNHNDTAASNLSVGTLQAGTISTSSGSLTLAPFNGQIWFGSVGAAGMRTSTELALASNASLNFTNGASNFLSATVDAKIVRGATGPTIQTQSEGGLESRNLANTAFAPITALASIGSSGVANTTTKQTDSAFQFSRTLDGTYVGSISRGTNSTANSVAIDYEANAGHFFKLAGATIASIGSTALTAGAGFLGIQNVHSLHNLTGAANNVLTITSDAAAGTVDGFVLERSTRSPVGNNKIVSFRYNGAVVASIGQYGDLSLTGKFVANRSAFGGFAPYMQGINESGRSEVELQQGLIAGYGGTVSCRAGDVANTGYFRMRYDTGYPKLETNANTLTLTSSTQSLTISTAYMSFGPPATPWLYLDGGTHKSRSSAGLHVKNLADNAFSPVFSAPRSSTVAPNTTDIASGGSVWWHDTVGNQRRFAYNDAGLIHLSPLLKASIPATPVDLPGVISVLQHWGLCA
jgi:hypothetical protein